MIASVASLTVAAVCAVPYAVTAGYLVVSGVRRVFRRRPA